MNVANRADRVLGSRGVHRLGALGGLAGTGFALIWGWALSSQTYNVYGSIALVPIVVAVNLLLIARVVARNPDEPWLPWVLVLGFVAKCVGTFGRYWVAYVVYAGTADAERYNLYASYQHQMWRQGQFVWEWGGKQGTQIMELITTAVYTVIGGSPLTGFFVFASLAFWGVYLLYRALRIAVPSADHRRYALLVFFLPSMLYWPSSIGKESWLLLFLGVTALGAAKYFAAKSGALWLLSVGGVGMGLVRPHIAVLVFAALLVAQLFQPTRGTSAGLLRKLGGLVVLGGAGLILARTSASFLGIDDLDAQAISETIDWSSGQTQQGGSEFTPVPLSNPLGIPAASVTILFRPFPWEAANAQMLLQSIEGLFLLSLVVLGWRRLRQVPHMLRDHPYLWFVIVYVMAFTVAFAGFSNFGILARQRSLMLPLFLVLLSLPRLREPGRQGLPVRAGDVAGDTGEPRRMSVIR